MNRENDKKQSFFAKAEQFLIEADKYEPKNVDQYIINLVNYASQYDSKIVTCKGNFRPLTDLTDDYLKDLETLAIETIDLLITIKVVILFIRAVRVLSLLNTFNDLYDKENRDKGTLDEYGRAKVNPYGLRVQLTLNGVRAEWYNRHAVIHWYKYPKGWNNEPKPNKKGSYTMLSFSSAPQSIREFISSGYEKILQVLRGQTKVLTTMREELSKYSVLSGNPCKKSGLTIREKIEAYLKNKSFPKLDPSLISMVREVIKFEGQEITEMGEKTYFGRLVAFYLDDCRMGKVDNEIDRNICFYFRLLKILLFIKGAKIFAYYYDRKKALLGHNRVVKKGSGKRVRIPYYPSIQMTKNGVSISWKKMIYDQSSSYRGMVRTAEHIVPKERGKYLRGDFKDATPLEKKFICDEIEPKFSTLRSQTAVCAALRRALRSVRLIHEKYFQDSEHPFVG